MPNSSYVSTHLNIQTHFLKICHNDKLITRFSSTRFKLQTHYSAFKQLKRRINTAALVLPSATETAAEEKTNTCPCTTEDNRLRKKIWIHAPIKICYFHWSRAGNQRNYISNDSDNWRIPCLTTSHRRMPGGKGWRLTQPIGSLWREQDSSGFTLFKVFQIKTLCIND